MLPSHTHQPRRPLAFHVYAALCAMTGICGLVLSLWAHPHSVSAPMQIAAQMAPVDYTAPIAVDGAGSL